jgi:hypothetical protein
MRPVRIEAMAGVVDGATHRSHLRKVRLQGFVKAVSQAVDDREDDSIASPSLYLVDGPPVDGRGFHPQDPSHGGGDVDQPD